MPISFRRSVVARTTLLLPAFLLCLLGLPASQAIGQETAPPTALEKQLSKVDLAVTAIGEISTPVSGIEQRDYNTTHTLLTIKPSSTVGELATVRYTMKPWVGFEFNFSNLRYTQDYTFVPPPSQTILTGGAQTGAHEITLGYVAHLKYHPLGITPFLGAGGGTIKFHPTPGGGQGLPFQYRAVYYYQAGLEDNFGSSPFGMRLGFRQLIYLAPDYIQNYLTITRRTRTSEPTVGFFVRF